MLFRAYFAVYLQLNVVLTTALKPDMITTLKFLSAGWAPLPGLLNQLQQPEIRDKIYRAEAQARLSYVDFAYRYLERLYLIPHQMSLKEACVVPPRRDADTLLMPLKELSNLADHCVQTLNQCLANVIRVNKNATLPYFQSMNVHRLDHALNLLATSRKLGKMAAALLQEPRISLYQTAVFLQTESGGVSRGLNIFSRAF